MKVTKILLEAELVVFQLMDKATRCTHNDVWNIVELTGLQHHVDATGDDGRAEVQVLPTKRLELFIDLVG